jgi:DNA topoisomerase-6 subunit A
VKTFAQTLKLMSLSKEMVEQDDFATKRDAYYQSKNWGDAKFLEQPESDAVMDDIEALFSLEGVTREQLRFYPEEHGGASRAADRHRPRPGDRPRGAHRLHRLRDGLVRDPALGRAAEVRDEGEVHPRDRDGRHVPAPEQPQVLAHVQLHPRRDRRRADARDAALHPQARDDCKLDVYAFNDCDPYGISNIYRTLKVGSGNAVHLNQFFCVPQARYLGVTPQDIIDFKLQDATHPLQEVDKKRAQGRAEERPVLPGAQGVAEGDRDDAEDGRARRAAGAREVGPQLRDRRVPADRS